MKYIGLDDGLSIDKQVSNFGQLLAQGADAIVLYPLAPNALRASLAKAKKQGVAVIGFNVTFTKSAKAPGYDAQVWEGRDSEAYLSVAALAQAAPKGKVAIIGIGAPVPAIKYLAQRYRFWAKKFGLQVVGEQDNPTDDITGGRQAMSGLLGKYSDLDGVLAYNDESAVGAYTAARSAGRNDIKIVGINGSSLGISALKAGRVAAIVQVDAVNQGAQAAAAAYVALTKQGKLPNVIVRPPHLLTKANLGSSASWANELAQIKSGHLSR
jgi:ribose transport system substrate-binding protein